MHELGLAAAVLQHAGETVAREGLDHVTLLALEVGQLAGVDIEALSFALDAIRPGSCLADASLLIDVVPGQAWCKKCQREVPAQDRLSPCPMCDAYPLRPTSGTDLRIVRLEGY